MTVARLKNSQDLNEVLAGSKSVVFILGGEFLSIIDPALPLISPVLSVEHEEYVDTTP